MSEQYDPLAAYLARGVLEEVNKKLNESLKLQKKLLQKESKSGEIRQVDLINDLNISADLLKTWEKNGLQRIKRGGSVFYLLEELHQFNY